MEDAILIEMKARCRTLKDFKSKINPSKKKDKNKMAEIWHKHGTSTTSSAQRNETRYVEELQGKSGSPSHAVIKNSHGNKTGSNNNKINETPPLAKLKSHNAVNGCYKYTMVKCKTKNRLALTETKAD